MRHLKKYLFLLRFEMKTILRDPMNLFMMIFPLVLLLISSFLFPAIFQSFDSSMQAQLKLIMLILFVVLLAVGAFFLAAMATFLLLEHKDECTLNTIAVTPVSTAGYLRFKMTYVYIMSTIATVIILFGTKLIAGDAYRVADVSLFDRIGIWHILSFAAVSSLFAPALALFQSAFAKNKVEGFAFIKGTGIIALVPVLMVFTTFEGGLQYILGIFPNFWAIKGLMLELMPYNSPANLSYMLYLIVGTIYNLMIAAAAYRLFLRKIKQA